MDYKQFFKCWGFEFFKAVTMKSMILWNVRASISKKAQLRRHVSPKHRCYIPEDRILKIFKCKHFLFSFLISCIQCINLKNTGFIIL